LKSIREDLEDVSARGLHLLATRLVQAPGQRIVLLLDQFEELFTLAISEQERQHFINLLVTAMTEPNGFVIVLLTLRADCYDRPLAYPAREASGSGISRQSTSRSTSMGRTQRAQ
jgi:hypothetical protein